MYTVRIYHIYQKKLYYHSYTDIVVCLYVEQANFNKRIMASLKILDALRKKLDIPCIGPSFMRTWTPAMCFLRLNIAEVESERSSTR